MLHVKRGNARSYQIFLYTHLCEWFFYAYSAGHCYLLFQCYWFVLKILGHLVLLMKEYLHLMSLWIISFPCIQSIPCRTSFNNETTSLSHNGNTLCLFAISARVPVFVKKSNKKVFTGFRMQDNLLSKRVCINLLKLYMNRIFLFHDSLTLPKSTEKRWFERDLNSIISRALKLSCRENISWT